jgi:hypothetical protein
VGWWETGHGVTRTQTNESKVEGMQKSLQFKTFIVSSRIVSYVILNHLHDHLSVCQYVPSTSVCGIMLSDWLNPRVVLTNVARAMSYSCN